MNFVDFKICEVLKCNYYKKKEWYCYNPIILKSLRDSNTKYNSFIPYNSNFRNKIKYAPTNIMDLEHLSVCENCKLYKKGNFIYNLYIKNEQDDLINRFI